MIANGQYMQKEIAYLSNEYDEYSPLQANMERLTIDLLNYAAENPDAEGCWEHYHKTPYQDNYYFEIDGVDYCIQHDIVAQTLVLYELQAI